MLTSSMSVITHNNFEVGYKRKYFVVITSNYDFINYDNYDKSKSVVITKVKYIFSEYKLKK